MKGARIVLGAFAVGLLVLAIAISRRAPKPGTDPAAAGSPTITPSVSDAAEETPEGLLHGRITTEDGDTYEGRLRWGGVEEALWGQYFNGFKKVNPWVEYVSPERLPKERHSIGIFGVEIARRERPIDLGRPFMARFGDITRIEARGLRELRVTLKSGTVVDLDRFSADDFADGLRVWDPRRGVVDLGERRMRAIELFPGAARGALLVPLHGTVRTLQGDFTGFLEWNREECVSLDALDGHTAEGELSLPFDAIRSIARHPPDSSLVTLSDGREVLLGGTSEVGPGNRGIYVDDPRYGRVLISWDAFEQVDFSPGGSGPAYRDFPAGDPLTGRVSTRTGRRLAGRLVYDLDESETTETLDASFRGVTYTIPLGLIASIALPGSEEHDDEHARVTLHSGEELELELSGDLGEGNAGMLILTDGDQPPAFVPWNEVEQVDFERPPAMYPPLDP